MRVSEVVEFGSLGSGTSTSSRMDVDLIVYSPGVYNVVAAMVNIHTYTFIHSKPRGFYDTSVLQYIASNAIQFTIETLLWRATLNDSTPLPQVVAARCPDSH